MRWKASSRFTAAWTFRLVNLQGKPADFQYKLTMQ